jgi:hypothetical protein
MYALGQKRTHAMQQISSIQFLAMIRYGIQKGSRLSIEKFDVRREAPAG